MQKINNNKKKKKKKKANKPKIKTLINEFGKEKEEIHQFSLESESRIWNVSNLLEMSV